MEEQASSSSWKQFAKRLLVTPLQISKLKVDLLLGKKTREDVLADILLDWNIRQKDPKSPKELFKELQTFPEFPEVVGESRWASMETKTSLTPVNTWVELERDIQEELLLKPVTFFENQRSLLEITDNLDELKLRDILQKYLTGAALQDFINASNYQLTKNMIPPRLCYYVSRTLSLRNQISKNIFKRKVSDIFLLKGIERSTLSLLADSSPTDISSNQVRCLTKRHIILEDIKHFGKICKMTAQPVHLINFKDGNFTWVTSRGDVSVIHEHITGEMVFCSEENLVTEFCQNTTDSMICISDSPGMGKSVFLANLARYIQTLYKNRIVVYYHAPDWIDLFNLNKENLNKALFIAILANSITLSTIGDTILKCLLQEEKVSMEIMLDGIDEVPTEDLEPLLKNLTFIQDLFKNTRIWVTTRPHLLKLLENRFIVLLVNIKPFEECDQKTFLVNYWTTNCNIFETKQLHKFSEICLSNIKTHLTDTITNIIGIPLQCYLLANVYSREALEFAHGLEKETLTVTSIRDLYRLFICNKYLVPTTTSINEFHIRLALNCIYPNHSSLFTQIGEDHNNSFISSIMEWRQGKARFIHRTFAEYLIAEFMVEKLRRNTKPDAGLSPLHRILPISVTTHQIDTSVTFTNSALCYFFDTLLMENSALDDLSLVALFNNKIQFSSTSRLSLMKAALHQKCYAIFCIIFSGLQGSNVADFVDVKLDEWLTLLLVATRHANLYIVTSLCNHVEEITGQDICQINFNQWKFFDVQMNPLHVSVKRGSFSIFEYFMRKYAQILPQITALVHIAVHKTQDLGDPTIQEKSQIIKHLSYVSGTKILDEKIGNGCTPILMDKINIELIKLLMKLGADINSRTPNLNTVAHNGATYMSSHDFKTLLDCIFKAHGAEIFEQKNFLNESPIQCAIKNLKISQEILDFYISSIDNEDEHTYTYRDTLLYHLIKYGYSGQYVEKAWNNSTKWKNMRYWDNSTTLLHIAVECGNFSTVEYLLENGGDSNALDKDGKTPLHIACDRKKISEEREKHGTMENIVAILLDYGACISIRDSFGKRPISYAFDST